MSGTSVKELFCLSGKVALITGSRNLGFDMAEALGESGAVVIVTSRDAETVEDSAQRLRAGGIDAYGMALEVSDEGGWKKTVSEVAERFDHIDILINNAGGRKPSYSHKVQTEDMSIEYLEERPIEDWNYTLGTNLTGTFIGCKTVSSYMKKQGGGKIINIASIDGVVGRDLRIYTDTGLSPTIPDYAASKGAIISLTRGIAVALAAHHINVNCICPGGFFRNQPEAFVKNYSEHVPLGRMGTDGVDIKGAALFLASAASDYVTGQSLIVDGGFTAW